MIQIPSARWNGKLWITEAGVEHLATLTQCPRKIGIVSTSLITAKVAGIDALLSNSYSCVVLDEAHRARCGNGQVKNSSPNNLMAYVRKLARRTKTLLLGSATPIQLDRGELYDLMELLSQNNDRVLGSAGTCWHDRERALNVVSGIVPPTDSVEECWRWLANPLPPQWERDRWHVLEKLWSELAEQGVQPNRWQAPVTAVQKFSFSLRSELRDEFPHLIGQHNPFIRHVVKRTRQMLTESRNGRDPYFRKVQVQLERDGEEDAIEMPPKMAEAYAHATEFCRLLAQRKPGAGIMKTLLLRRIGSSLHAGLATAQKLLGADDTVFDEEDEEKNPGGSSDLTAAEFEVLSASTDAMRAAGDNDRKLEVAVHYLREREWAEQGCIIFSQYFDTVQWFAQHISLLFPELKVGVYAGGGKSYLLQGGVEEPASREELKRYVQERRIKLLVATDAASEGLNLQRLQTLINLDLPWNPARLEQRKGRIDRIGQLADTIYLLNLRYKDSVEDDVHRRLSERLKQVRDVFGTIPDHLEDLWVDIALGDIEAAKQKINGQPRRHPFDIRYNHSMDESGWDECATVLNRLEIMRELQKGWQS